MQHFILCRLMFFGVNSKTSRIPKHSRLAMNPGVNRVLEFSITIQGLVMTSVHKLM